MLVDESLNHLQVTTGTLNRDRSVSSLIHCNCGYKQIMDAKKFNSDMHTHIYALVDTRGDYAYFPERCMRFYSNMYTPIKINNTRGLISRLTFGNSIFQH